MIKCEYIEVFGWRAALRGMRNPMNSWDKSDTKYITFCVTKEQYKLAQICGGLAPMIGENDLDLMRRLYKGGSEHRKYSRMLHIQMDITAPMYFWKQYSTYKVATTENSTSTMHKIHAKEFEADDFSHEHLSECKEPFYYNVLETVINGLNSARNLYLKTKEKIYWWAMIQLLPSSYNQRRTVDFTYETAFNMIDQRDGHKLDEWHEFVNILRSLPYVAEIRGEVEE